MPPGVVSLDDVDLDQLVDFVLNCARKGGLLELSDSNLFPHMSNAGSNDEFFLATNPELYRVCLQEDYPRLSLYPHHHQFCQHSQRQNQLTEPFEELSSLSKSQSLSSTQQQELTMLLLILCLDCRHLLLIETVSGTLVLRWVNSQLARILNWVDRAIQQERWVPVSPQQRQGSSIVEVYWIVEETVDQFFALEVPMRPGELGSLFRGIDNAFQVYAKTVVDKIAYKEDIVPPVPILTRYSRESGIKAFVKKELKDTRIPDVLKSVEIDVVAASTLCVQLNSLHYAISQLNKLEDSIRARWTRKKHHDKLTKNPAEETAKGFQKKDSFDGSRKDINAAIDRMCEFTGTKIIFCDLSETFIENLYKPSVSQSRLELVMEPLDMGLVMMENIVVVAMLVRRLLQPTFSGELF